MITNSKYGAAVHVGADHRSANGLCQDCAIAMPVGDLMVLAVSDGMDSAKFSELGSSFATRYVVEHARELYDEFLKVHGESGYNGKYKTVIKNFFKKMAVESTYYANDVGARSSDINATLSFAIIGPEWTVLASLGDTSVHVKTERCLDHFCGNDISLNPCETYNALSEAYACVANVKAVITSSVTAILITTDGCEKLGRDSIYKDSFNYRFYKMFTGEKSVSSRKLASQLVNSTADDCGFAFYVVDTNNF